MAYEPAWQDQTSANIDVTPLVNVALILLIVFMVVTPMIRQGIEVNLPEADYGRDSSEKEEDQVVVTVKAGREFYVNLKSVTREGLAEELAWAYRGKEGKSIVVKGDENLLYGEILEVMQACREVGAPDVKLVTRRTDEEE